MGYDLLERNPLFEECLEELGVNLLPEKKSQAISTLFQKTYPITNWGKIDWDKIPNKIEIGQDPQNIIVSLQKLLKYPIDKSVYIEWGSGEAPLIQADLDSVIENFFYVKRVSFEKFIFNPKQGYIIEKIHIDPIVIGVLDFSSND